MSVKRAWISATRTAPIAFTIGIGVALSTGLSLFHVAGAAVIVGMTLGALVGLLRR